MAQVSAQRAVARRRFRVLETLGRGGFGVVYRAESVGHGGFTKQVALKVLRKDVDLANGVAERLRDEARILGLINHRAVVRVDGLIELENGWAIVMEYVPGVNLSVLVAAGCPPRAAAEIIEEVAGALDAAWAETNEVTGEPLRLVHRDIKPANIRLTPQGAVKVLDFGVARADFADREAHTVSVLFGSMRYMAPERLDGIEGPATDVFALGIVFAELLGSQRYDEPPKNPKRYADWLDDVVNLAIRRLPADAQARVAVLLGACLAYDEEKRPSARELQRTCRELARTLPGAALRDFAEDNVPDLIDAVSKARSHEKDDAANSVLVEQGSEAIVSDITGITRTRRVVGLGLVGGSLVLTVGMGVLAVVLLPMVIWLVWPFAGSDVAVAPEPETPALPGEVPPALPLEVPPAPATPAPDPVPIAPEPAPPPEPEPEPFAEVPEPVPVPAPSGPPPPPRPQPAGEGSGTIRIAGEPQEVELRGPTQLTLRQGSHEIGSGSYRVYVHAWSNESLLTVHVAPGDEVAVRCAMWVCKKE